MIVALVLLLLVIALAGGFALTHWLFVLILVAVLLVVLDH